MAEKGKVEDAERAGEIIGKGMRIGLSIVRGFGKGLKEGIEGKEEKK